MAHFGYLSDTDDSAVEDLLTQAQELSVLEQVSKINCSSFTTDSALPTDLQTRFHKLKSFPPHNPKASVDHNSLHNSNFPQNFSSDKVNRDSSSSSVRNPEAKLCDKGESYGFGKVENMDDDMGLKKKGQKGSVSSTSDDSSDSWIEALKFSPSKMESEMRERSKLKAGSFNIPSPPKKTGCFWFSPSKVLRKKKKEENRDLDWENEDDEILSDLKILSVKEQQKILKKAMKQEEKINKEAEKIVKWAMQGSARMSFHGIVDEPSDDDTENGV